MAYAAKTRKPKPLLRWPGSKAHLMPKLIPLIPEHRRYVSVFGGAGGDIRCKPRSRVEVFNDLDESVVSVFEMIRRKRDRKQLCFRLLHTPYSRLQHRKCCEVLKSDKTTPLERAWAFVHANRTSYCGLTKSFAVPKSCGLKRAWFDVVARIESNARRFRQVIIERLDWRDILKKYDAPDNLFYADPPYLLSTRTCQVYTHEMDHKDHEELLDALRSVEGLVMLSGYDSNLYADRLADWRRVEFEVRCQISGKKKPMRTEVVWMNYDQDGKRLFPKEEQQ